MNMNNGRRPANMANGRFQTQNVGAHKAHFGTCGATGQDPNEDFSQPVGQ